MFSISKCLDVWPTPTYQKTNIKNLTAKLRNVSYSDIMMNQPKAIHVGYMMLKTRLYTAEMSILMNNPMTLLLVANQIRILIG